jgi:ADP-heptose:LPS heptosyltransferase
MLFVGAGGAGKRWPLERWERLAGRLRERCAGGKSGIALCAGPVEAEKFTPEERGWFERAGGEFLGIGEGVGGLERLARRIGASRAFVGCDTGPTHLAAQLGVPTIGLFGPTDPGVWGPVGPRVRVIAPETARGMAWLEPKRVVAAVRAMLAE